MQQKYTGKTLCIHIALPMGLGFSSLRKETRNHRQWMICEGAHLHQWAHTERRAPGPTSNHWCVYIFSSYNEVFKVYRQPFFNDFLF